MVPRVPSVSSETWPEEGAPTISLPEVALGRLGGLRGSPALSDSRTLEKSPRPAASLKLCELTLGLSHPGLCLRVQDAGSGLIHRIMLFVIYQLCDLNEGREGVGGNQHLISM